MNELKEIWLIRCFGTFWTYENGWNTLDKGVVFFTSRSDADNFIENLTEDWEPDLEYPIAVGFVDIDLYRRSLLSV